MSWTQNAALAQVTGPATAASLAGQEGLDFAFSLVEALNSEGAVTLYVTKNGTDFVTVEYSALTSSGKTISLPASPTTVTTADATVSSGTFTARIESADGTYVLSTTDVSNSSGHDVVLSGDVTEAGGVSVSGSITSDARLPYSSGGSGGGGGSSSGTLPDYDNLLYRIDPRLPFASCTNGSIYDTEIECNGAGGTSVDDSRFYATSEPGISEGGNYRLRRMTDPIRGGSHMAFEVSLYDSDNLAWEGSTARRNEMSGAGGANRTYPGDEYAVAISLTRWSDMSWALWNDYRDGVLVWQNHFYESGFTPSPPLSVFVHPNGITTNRRNTANPNGDSVFDAVAMSIAAYTQLFFSYRLARTAGGNPYFKVWRADNFGSWRQIRNDVGVPTTYDQQGDVDPSFLKTGGYWWNWVQQWARAGGAPSGGTRCYHLGLVAANLTDHPGALTLDSAMNHFKEV